MLASDAGVRGTSREAFHALNLKASGGLQLRILTSLLREGPGTAEEVAARLKEPYPSVWRRCSDLKGKGLVRETGTRKNSTGRAAYVLATTRQGREALKEGTSL